MAQHAQVPKFGNWEDDEDVPYATVFDNAKKNRSAKMDANNPQDNPDFQEEAKVRVQKGPDAEFKSNKSELEEPKGPNALRPKHETDSPIRHENAAKKATVDSPLHHHGGVSATDSPKRVSRQSVGSDRSFENSPLHPHHQAKAGNKSGPSSSPSWERKGSSEGNRGLGSTTPGRSRLRSVTRGDETPDNSLAVPKFGDWDENDPASAEGYTHIFNRVREEKHSGSPMITTETNTFYGQKRYGNGDSKGCGCFPWGRK